MLHCPTHHIIFDFVIPDNNDEKYKILELFTIQFPSSSCVLECPDVLLRITSQKDRQTVFLLLTDRAMCLWLCDLTVQQPYTHPLFCSLVTAFVCL